MTELIFEVREGPEGGYVAKALSAAIFTEAEDLETLRDAIRDAVRCHFDPGTGAKGHSANHHPGRSPGRVRLPRDVSEGPQERNIHGLAHESGFLVLNALPMNSQ